MRRSIMALQQHRSFPPPTATIETIARAAAQSRVSILWRNFQSLGFKSITASNSLDRIPNAIQKNEEIREVSIPIFPFNKRVDQTPAKDKDPSIETRELLQIALGSHQDNTLAKIQEMEGKVQRLATKLEQISRVTEVQMKINRVNLSYGSGKLIAAPPRNRHFRAQLLEVYGYKRFSKSLWMDPKKKMKKNKKLYCPVVQRLVPAKNLIAAHIFKHEWARVAEAVIGLEDIDDPRNGLMLFSPIEHCFDRLQLCFVVDPRDRQIVCRVLDPSLKDCSLLSVAKARGNWSGIDDSDDDQELEKLSFQEIDGRRLDFTTDHRPLPEALNFHARQARLHAISKGWIDGSWDFQDFYTDGERWEKLRVWIDQELTNVD